MIVKKTFENQNGVMTFEGEFSPAEVNLVMTVGIATLLQQGAFPHIQENGMIRVDNMETNH